MKIGGLKLILHGFQVTAVLSDILLMLGKEEQAQRSKDVQAVARVILLPAVEALGRLDFNDTKVGETTNSQIYQCYPRTLTEIVTNYSNPVTCACAIYYSNTLRFP